MKRLIRCMAVIVGTLLVILCGVRVEEEQKSPPVPALSIDEPLPAAPIAVTMEETEETKPVQKIIQVGYIYLGDSRFVGMNNAVGLDEYYHTTVIAEVGKGYQWLVNTAWPETLSVISSNEDIDKWLVVSNLGVNDLGNVDKYIEFYESIDMDNVQLILVSVNPVEQSGCEAYGYDYDKLSKGIPKFNKRLQETEFDYIDTYSYLMENGFSAPDGLHYGKDTYEKISNKILWFLVMGPKKIGFW